MEKTTNKIYTADEVYKVINQSVCDIVWEGIRFDVYAFNEDDIWMYDEADELHTTHEAIAQALNNGDTIEFYRLERVEI